MTERLRTRCEEETNYEQGTFRFILENPKDLQLDDVRESPTFEAGVFKLRIILTYMVDNCGLKAVEVVVISPNDKGVSADAELSIINPRQPPAKRPAAIKKKAIARPQCDILQHGIPICDLTDSSERFHSEDELIVEVKLKHIEEAHLDKLQKNKNNMDTVKIQVIDKNSIRDGLDIGHPHGLAILKQTIDLPIGGFTRSWARSFPDCRQWLCRRKEDGSINVERCLNNASALETFESIYKVDDQAQRLVTVFKEEKEAHESFEPIGDNIMIVFCKGIYPRRKDVFYYRHIHVQKTEKCQSLLQTMAVDIAQFPEGRNYDAFLEKADRVEDITTCTGLLEECGIHPGSVIVLKERQPGLVRVIQQAPANRHVGVTDAQGSDGSKNNPEGDAPRSNMTVERQTSSRLNLLGSVRSAVSNFGKSISGKLWPRVKNQKGQISIDQGSKSGENDHQEPLN